MTPPLPKQIAIMGCSGSGKSTLARELGSLFSLPVIHLDQLFWQSGWKQVPTDVFRPRAEEVIGSDSWVIDGNYTGTLDLRLARADMAIYLDLPTSVCLARVLGRTFRLYGQDRPDIAPGCPERLDLPFIHYILTYRQRARRKILDGIASHPHLEVHRIGSAGEVTDLIDTLRRRAQLAATPECRSMNSAASEA